MKISSLLLGLIASLAMLTPFPSIAEQPIVIKFSHVVARNTPKGMAADRFKELVETRTQGHVKVEVYPDSRLFTDKEELEALQIGAVQMLAPSLSKFGPLGIEPFEVFDLPYLFPNEDSFLRVTQGKIGRDLFKSLEDKGIVGLAYWSGGYHVFSANRPLVRPNDLKGLTMRIPPSEVIEASSRQLGALPQVIPFSDVFLALQAGMVDGTENILSSYTSQKYYEVQKNITLTYHTHTGYAVIVNKRFWEALPKDIQATLVGAMKEATNYEFEQLGLQNAEALKFLKASGKTQVLDLNDAQRAVWIKALLPVYTEMEPRVGREVIQAVKTEAGALNIR